MQVGEQTQSYWSTVDKGCNSRCSSTINQYHFKNRINQYLIKAVALKKGLYGLDDKVDLDLLFGFS